MNFNTLLLLFLLIVAGCGGDEGNSSSPQQEQREEHPEDSYRSLIGPLSSSIIGTASAERSAQGIILRIKIINAPSKPLYHLIFPGSSCPDRSQIAPVIEVRSRGNMDRKILVENFSLKGHAIGVYGESGPALACGAIVQIPYEG